MHNRTSASCSLLDFSVQRVLAQVLVELHQLNASGRVASVLCAGRRRVRLAAPARAGWPRACDKPAAPCTSGLGAASDGDTAPKPEQQSRLCGAAPPRLSATGASEAQRARRCACQARHKATASASLRRQP